MEQQTTPKEYDDQSTDSPVSLFLVTELLERWGQTHLLRFYEELSYEEQQILLRDIRSLDLQHIMAVYRSAMQKVENVSPTGYTYIPPPVATTWTSPTSCVLNNNTDDIQIANAPCFITRLAQTPTDIVDSWRRRGLEMIALNQVGCVILAGGQGTRLGWHQPKGTFPIGPISGKSLFQIFCEKHAAVIRLARQQVLETMEMSNKGRHRNNPMYIMTAETNYAATVEFFELHDYFGLNREDVHFFKQEDIPALSLDGKILLQTKSTIVRAPNGNGGLFSSLQKSGMLAHMKRSGLVGFHTFSIDNALTKVLDPVLIGYTDLLSADIGNKCAEKVDPNEKVGVLSLRRPTTDTPLPTEASIIEYTELPEKLCNMRLDTPSANSNASAAPLAFSAGNICNHYFRVDFVEKLLDASNLDRLWSAHAAYKKIPCTDLQSGECVAPATPNGIKIEYFIFDCFPFAKKVLGLEVERDTEFAPLKDADGANSPAACRLRLSNTYKTWMRKAGVTLVGDGELEISPTVSYGGEQLEELRRTPLQLPNYVAVRPSGPGVSATDCVSVTK